MDRPTARATAVALASALAWPLPARAQPAPTPAADPGDRAPGPALAGKPDGTLEAAAWTTAGLSVTLVLTGFIFTASANAREDDIRRLTGFRSTSGRPGQYQGAVAARYQDKVEEGQRFEGWARAAFVSAGLAAAGATVLFVVNARASRERSAAVAPQLGPDRVGIAAQWRF